MERRRFLVVSVACGVLGLACARSLGGGELCRMEAPEGLIVHEWGTFTSFCGSDGSLMYFNTTVAEKLPDFVFTRPRQRGDSLTDQIERSGKTAFWTRQRMETPVLYFYAPKAMSVDVRVDFPQGIMTEFYPPVTSFSPEIKKDTERSPGDGQLVWKGVTITPPKDAEKANLKPPGTGASTHYAAARGVEPAALCSFTHAGVAHNEKFLFYRGVANFDGGLVVKSLEANRFQVTTTRKEEWGCVVIVQNDGARLRWAEVTSFVGEVEIQLREETGSVEQASEALVRGLRRAGMFELEARAMVSTWRDDWFGGRGTRVLGVMPRASVDELLPLTIEPKPAEVKRGFVARVEVLTPELERRIEGIVASGSPDRADVWRRLQDEVGWMGRFLPPAADHVKEITTKTAVRERLAN